MSSSTTTTTTTTEEEDKKWKEFVAWFDWKRGATLYETMHKIFGAFHSQAYLGTRQRFVSTQGESTFGEYRFLTYADAWMRAQSFGSGLKRASGAKDQLFVAICASNTAHWLIADLASVMYGFALVPIHTSVDVATARYVLEHSDSSVLVTQRDMLAKMFESLRDIASCKLKLVVCVDPFEDFAADERAAVTLFRRHGVVVTTFEAISSDGGANFVPHAPQTDPQAIYSLLYTSGSTGVPKGAVMTMQRWNNFICAPYLMPDPVVTLSMAPLAHVAERQGVWLTTGMGGSIGFFNGDMARIFDDFAALNPTMHSATPRFYNRIYSEFQATLAAQLAAQPHASPESVESDVIRQFSTLLGNRIQFLVTGSAMTSPTVKEFVRRCFGKRLYDGYGTTEAGGIATDDTISRDVDVRLEDVPDLGYLSSDKPFPRGEICVKTKVMIGGYHKNADATREAFTSDGYFRTGDIGQREPNNVVRIIDRKKSVFKLGNGEFVAPEKLEGLFVQSELIAQICVVGDTKWDCLLAVVVPNRRVVVQRHIDADDDAAVARALIADMRRIGTECSLASFEVPWRVLVEWTEFSASNGLLTYSEKMQRRKVEERYRERLHAIYDSLSNAETAAVSSEIDAIVAGGDAVDSLSAVRLQSLLRSKFAVDVSVAQLLQAESKEALLRLATTARSGGANDELSAQLQSAVTRDLELVSGMPMPTLTLVALPQADAPLLLTGATGFVGSFVLERLLNGSVTLSVSCANTTFGDTLAVCGSVPELGSWNVADAVALATSSEAFPQWRCTLALPRNVDVEFKFLLRRANNEHEFEAFDGNRRVRVRAGVDCSVECGSFGRLCTPTVRESALPAQVVALVRGATDDDARKRLLDVLHSRSIAIDDSRLRVVAGDVALPQLGLGTSVYEALARSVGSVVHCAATVNWLSTYAQLRDSNVIGTLNVLEFVSTSSRKRLLHVSTIGVSAGAADGDWLAPHQFVQSSGYNVTKLVAERLTLAFAAELASNGRDPLPIVIVRPGMVSSHSLTGAHNPSDYIPRYVRGCVQLGSFIDDARALLEMIPVDWVAEQIGALALQTTTGVRTITLSNVAHSPTYLAIANAAKAAAAPAPVDVEPYVRWQQRLQRDANVENALYPLLTHFGAERLTMQWRVLDVSRSSRILAADGVDTRPIIGKRALERLVRRFY
jgi:long-chain acyl-CoA synthetase